MTDSSASKGWTVVKPKVRVRPKYISKEKAFGLQRTLDIMGLSALLSSIESRNLQEDGWIFEGVIKKDDETRIFTAATCVYKEKSNARIYVTLPIANKWEDQAIFSRPKV